MQIVLIWNLVLCFLFSLWFNRYSGWTCRIVTLVEMFLPFFQLRVGGLPVCCMNATVASEECLSCWMKTVPEQPWYHPASLGNSALCCACPTPTFVTLLHSHRLALSPCVFPTFGSSLYLLELQRLQTQQCYRLLSPSCCLEHQNFPSQF